MTRNAEGLVGYCTGERIRGCDEKMKKITGRMTGVQGLRNRTNAVYFGVLCNGKSGIPALFLSCVENFPFFPSFVSVTQTRNAMR